MPGSCPFSAIVLLTRALVLVFSLPLALVRCGSASPPSVPEDLQSERSNEGAGVDAGCSAAFLVDEEIRPLAEQAAERWSAATGCAITVGDSGIEVRLAASVPYGEGGKEVPGWTRADLRLVLIHSAPNAVHRYRTLSHEMGHALGGLHTASHGVLSGEKGRRDVIDAEALETVCARLPCVLLSPEAP
jgi:hypothetical protein